MPRNSMTLTLVNANQNYQLATLIAAIDANTRRGFNEINLEADIGNADTIRYGDGALSAADFGGEIIAGDSRRFASGDGTASRSTERIYMRSATAGQKIHFTGIET